MAVIKPLPNRFLLFALLSLLCSCEIINPDEQTPAYITIESIQLTQNPNVDAGSLSSDISDAWILIDDNNIGVYELPAKIPVLEEGIHKLTIGPGIVFNGQEQNRELYLFYEGYTDAEFEFIAGEIIEVNPIVRYRSASDDFEYVLIDDFEGFTTNMQPTAASETGITKTTESAYVFEGNGSGLIMVEATDTFVEIRTTQSFALPNLGKIIYLEFDYYSDFHLTVGVNIKRTGKQNQVADLLTLKPITDNKWKKQYLQFTSIISNAQDPESEFFYFRLNRSLSPEQVDGRIILDNLKIIYQKP